MSTSKKRNSSPRKGGRPSKSNNFRNRKKDFDEENDIDEVVSKKESKAGRPHVLTKGGSNNDPSWYTHIYPLAEDVANIPYNYPTGTTFNVLNGNNVQSFTGLTSSPKSAVNAHTVAGIMSMLLAPSIGVSTTNTSAANIAAQQIYTLTRKANSGAANYDKTDLMMMIISMDSAYMLYEYFLRAYKVLGTYDYMSRYMPKALLHSMGFNYADLNRNAADFKALLDLFAYKLASVNVPDQFDFIHRHSWLFSNVYKDSQDVRSQLYVFNPDGWYIWAEGTTSTPNFLKYTSNPAFSSGVPSQSNLWTLDKMYDAMDAIMEPILGSQSVGNMSGDLMKAFGEGGMIKIQTPDTHLFLEPVHDMEVINQMMNAQFCDGSATNMDITQNLDDTIAGPYLEHQPCTTSGGNTYKYMRNVILNIHNLETNPGNNMVVTRLAPTFTNTPNPSPNYRLGGCGTEIPTRMSVSYIMVQNYGESDEQISFTTFTIDQDDQAGVNSSASTLSGNISQFMLWSQFDNAPTIYLWNTQGPGGDFSYLGALCDMDKYTIVTHEQLNKMHEVALMSLFAVKDYKSGLTS
nr:putative capsid [Marmot picobirnavirus]